MTCSTLSAIIASAENAKYGRKPGWRSAANAGGFKGVRAIYRKRRECRDIYALAFPVNCSDPFFSFPEAASSRLDHQPAAEHAAEVREVRDAGLGAGDAEEQL